MFSSHPLKHCIGKYFLKVFFTSSPPRDIQSIHSTYTTTVQHPSKMVFFHCTLSCTSQFQCPMQCITHCTFLHCSTLCCCLFSTGSTSDPRPTFTRFFAFDTALHFTVHNWLSYYVLPRLLPSPVSLCQSDTSDVYLHTVYLAPLHFS